MPRTLEEWLEWQQRVHHTAMDFTLERLASVLARLPIRRPKGPVIVVGGTNGKGSVTALLAALLAADGRRVGVYSSPHLERYGERIRLDGEEIATDLLLEIFAAIERARGDVTLTFFEYATAAALLAFSTSPLDSWVLEVGLGGRLDAVNLVDGDAAVVVSVALDHTELLGGTLDEIGREKAGIFRAGRPALYGTAAPPAAVIEAAAGVGAPLYVQGRDFAVVAPSATAPPGSFSYRGLRVALADLPPPALAGAIQRENAATALATLETLACLPARAAIEQALRRVRLPGRFERMTTADGREWLLDVAHNPAAAATLARSLRESPARGRSLAVYGALRDKDVAAVAAALAGCFDAWLAVTLPGERGLTAGELAGRVGAGFGPPRAMVASVAAALARARAETAVDDRIVVFGSFLVVGPAREWLRLYSAPGP
jgi:dihydrofolate synthase / folylpolyglutamate synthase